MTVLVLNISQKPTLLFNISEWKTIMPLLTDATRCCTFWTLCCSFWIDDPMTTGLWNICHQIAVQYCGVRLSASQFPPANQRTHALRKRVYIIFLVTTIIIRIKLTGNLGLSENTICEAGLNYCMNWMWQMFRLIHYSISQLLLWFRWDLTRNTVTSLPVVFINGVRS